MIKSIKEINSSNQTKVSYKLFVIGDGADYELNKNFCEKYRLNNIVTFLGNKTRYEMPIWMSAADILVIPSRREGYGLVAVESLICGTPVIASNVGELSSIISDFKILV